MYESFTDAQIATIVDAAGAAPSVHNSQPWRFHIDDGGLQLVGVIERALAIADPSARALYVSCGAALLNARLGTRMLGLEPVVQVLPHPEYPFDVLALLHAHPGLPPTSIEQRLYGAIWQRHTNRGPYKDKPVPRRVMTELHAAALDEFAALHVPDVRQSTRLLVLAAQAGQQLAADADHQAELRRWIATGRDDGIPAEALPAMPRSVPPAVRTADFLAVVPNLARQSVRYERFPQLAVLSTEDDEPEDWLRAGQALQRMLLTAAAHGISASFLYQPLELADMLEDGPPDWPGVPNLQMVMRLGYPIWPTPPTPRRPREDLIRRRPRERGSALL